MRAIGRVRGFRPTTQLSARPLRSKFASSCFCKNVFPQRRKGAKREREEPRRYLRSFAPLREMFGCGCAALRARRLSGGLEGTKFSTGQIVSCLFTNLSHELNTN
jgi:hypothetical protein